MRFYHRMIRCNESLRGKWNAGTEQVRPIRINGSDNVCII